jgi:hypothetical protein
LKKANKVDGETMEAHIINLFGFTLKHSISEWEKAMFKTIQIALLKNWNKHFASDSKL